MVVPLPSGADVDLSPPDADQVHEIWSGLVAAVGGGLAGLTPLQELLLRSLTRAMTATEDLGDPTPVDAAGFAEHLARRNLAFRERVCQVMLLGALVVRPPDEAAMARIAAFCEQLDVGGQLLEITLGHSRGSFELAVADFDRLGYLGAGEHVGSGSDVRDTVWASVEVDPVLAGRWRSLGELPETTLGREVHDFYAARGFAFPGEPGSAPPLLAQHDGVHVVADYGTVLENELEVFGYIARANDDARAFSLLAMVVSLFETGVVDRGMGLFEADPGHLARSGMAQRLGDAMRLRAEREG